MSVLGLPHYNDEDAARRWLEAVRWPNGPVCPHRGTIGRAYEAPHKGKRKARAGRYRWSCPGSVDG